jgi:polar amino acid transport system substrate-binding protein
MTLICRYRPIGCILFLIFFSFQSISKEIRLIAPQLPPFSFVDDGKPKGFMVETLVAVARAVGHSGTVKLVPAPRMLQEMNQGSRMISAVAAHVPLRAQKFTLLETGVEQAFSLVSLRRKGGVLTLETARGLKSVGIIKHGYPEIFLKDQGFTNLDTANTEDANLRKLLAGRIDAWFSSRWVVPVIMAQEKADPALVQVSEPLLRFPLNFAATQDISAEELAPWVAELNRFRSAGGLARLIERYQTQP